MLQSSSLNRIFDQGNGRSVELSGCYVASMATALAPLSPPPKEKETERLSPISSLLTRSSHFDCPSQDGLRFHTAAKRKGLGSRCVCLCMYSVRHTHACCVQYCVDLGTDSNNNLKMEEPVMVAKDIQPLLFVQVLAVAFTARTDNIGIQEQGVLEGNAVLTS